ncbi:MAG: hypothetical protein ASARMPREDX12_000628 [Alectoria sarmentosa]|nr:MAG: hypothetical protein ASARMPREDX12_000628 [Alectoria sarmentosa]
MDRIPTEIFRLVVSMMDGDDALSAYRKDDRSATAGVEGTLQSPTDVDAESEAYAAEWRRQRSLLARSSFRKWLTAYRQQWSHWLLRSVNKVDANALARVDELARAPEVQVTKLATLKALRLCNKRLAVMTAESLFEDVLLHFTAESHAKLELISHHPTYKTYVRRLHIIPKAISGPLLQKRKFGTWICGDGGLFEDESTTYVAHEHWRGCLGTRAVLCKISQKMIDFHYVEYSSLHAKQQKLLDEAEAVLQGAIGRLPQLKRIESGLYWDWNRKRQDITSDDYDQKSGWSWNRKRLDLSPRDDVIDRVWKAGACRKRFDPDQGALVLRAVACGKATSGARLDVGPLLRDMETKTMQVARLDEEAVMNTLMAGIEHFCFYSNTVNGGAFQEQVHSDRLTNFLQAMSKLACQPLRSNHLGADQSTENVGNIITWPQLNHLSIRGIDSLDIHGLAALIYRHKDSLRQLTLYDVVYQDEKWCNLWADLQAGALEKIRIWPFQRSIIRELGRRAAATQGLPAMELRREAHRWADFGSHHETVFCDGAWSPRLGSYLREELVAKLFPSFAHAQTGLLADGDEKTEEAGSEM